MLNRVVGICVLASQDQPVCEDALSSFHALFVRCFSYGKNIRFPLLSVFVSRHLGLQIHIACPPEVPITVITARPLHQDKYKLR